MRIVVVGSGIAGVTLAEELRKAAPNVGVTLVTAERRGYYSRPLLSHGFSREDIEDKIVMRSFDALRGGGMAVLDGVTVTRIDRGRGQVVYLDGDAEAMVDYDLLALATGSAALVPPPFRAFESHLRYVNSLDDLIGLRRLRREVLRGGVQPRWAIVGGGLIGCEVASDLAKVGDSVTLFHALDRLMERQLETPDSEALTSVLRAAGVTVHLDCPVTQVEPVGSEFAVRAASLDASGFHGVIAACGFMPRVNLAKEAGLATERGIVVDGYLRCDDQKVFALGDAAQCTDGKLYAYVTPVRSQALWLAQFIAGKTDEPWQVPAFKPKAKVHGFTAALPYRF